MTRVALRPRMDDAEFKLAGLLPWPGIWVVVELLVVLAVAVVVVVVVVVVGVVVAVAAVVVELLVMVFGVAETVVVE